MGRAQRRAGQACRTTGRRLGWEKRRLEKCGTSVPLLQPVAEDPAGMGGNLMSTARRHRVSETAQRTVAEQIARSDLPQLLADSRAPRGTGCVARPARCTCAPLRSTASR